MSSDSFAFDLPGFAVEVLAQIDSTNSELMRRARAGRLEPVLLVAEQQTAGRGRLGRQWFSEQALTFSIGMPLSPQDWSGLSLAGRRELMWCFRRPRAADIRPGR